MSFNDLTILPIIFWAFKKHLKSFQATIYHLKVIDFFFGLIKLSKLIISHEIDEIGTDPEIFIPYISRGFLASITDAIPVMELISNELKNRTYNFAINTYALIDESKPIMYETTFLKEIAAMNFRRFNVDSPSIEKIRVL